MLIAGECVVLTARDAHLVSLLNTIDKKVDTVMRIVSKLTADSTPAPPEMPDDITLPVNSETDLEAVEKTLAEDSALKSCMVSM